MAGRGRALLVIALTAAVDSLRGESPSAQPPSAETEDVRTEARGTAVTGPPPIRDRQAVAAELAGAQVSGVLYLTDHDCRLWALHLPTLTWLNRVNEPGSDCRFVLSGSGRPLFGDGLWDPADALSAVENGSEIAVRSEATGWSFEFEGSEPAFRPDGTLTFVRGDELWEWDAGSCPAGAERVVFRAREPVERCARVLLSQTAVRRALRGEAPQLDGYLAKEAVWLDQETVAVLVEGRSGRGAILATLAEGRLRRHFGAFGPRLEDLEASPRGTYVAARFDQTTVVLSRRRTEVLEGSVRAIAWPADERHTVLATESSVLIRRPGEPMLQIPVAASDIAWAD